MNSVLSLGKLWWDLSYFILVYLKNNQSEVLSPLDILSSRNNDINMIEIVYRNLTGVSNMADQGRVTLQNFGLCNLSIYAQRNIEVYECSSVYLAYF